MSKNPEKIKASIEHRRLYGSNKLPFTELTDNICDNIIYSALIAAIVSAMEGVYTFSIASITENLVNSLTQNNKYIYNKISVVLRTLGIIIFPKYIDNGVATLMGRAFTFNPKNDNFMHCFYDHPEHRNAFNTLQAVPISRFNALLRTWDIVPYASAHAMYTDWIKTYPLYCDVMYITSSMNWGHITQTSNSLIPAILNMRVIKSIWSNQNNTQKFFKFSSNENMIIWSGDRRAWVLNNDNLFGYSNIAVNLVKTIESAGIQIECEWINDMHFGCYFYY